MSRLPILRRPTDEEGNIWGIRRDALETILEAARSSAPEEFGAVLRAEAGVITELLLVPGTVSGERHALFQFHHLPVDYAIAGTVHSHPSGIAHPSEADRELFRRFGWVHIIVGAPFDARSWVAYNVRGDPIVLKLVEPDWTPGRPQ